MATSQRDSTRAPEQLLTDNLELIERLISYVCHRLSLRDDEAEEFGAEVRLSLVDDDYAVLREFRGKSKLTTYLTAVILNQARDFRMKRYGRWRPSAAALRLGVVAVELETLLRRDGFSPTEATQMLRHRGVKLTTQELNNLVGRLPVRVPRCRETESRLDNLAANEGDRADAATLAQEEARKSGAILSALGEVMAELPSEDALILRMRFESGLTVAAIARSLGIKQSALYCRLKKTLAGLRRRMIERGCRYGSVRPVLNALQ